MSKQSRKAQTGDMMSVVYFMLLLVIIGGTIFMMANVIIGKGYDARLTDASLLSHHIEECLSDKAWTLNEIKDIESTCAISLNDQKYVLHVYVGDDLAYRYGDAVSCGLYSIGEQNARCTQSSVIADVDGKKSDIRIIAGSNNMGEDNE